MVGEAADAISGEQVTVDTRPDVVLMDLNLGPGLDGIAGIGMLNGCPTRRGSSCSPPMTPTPT